MSAAEQLLGDYLKDRRARLDPAALGFTASRRRTPGLRREEVASRANVSTTWYTWLEQGRGGAPSADVLDRGAPARRSETERRGIEFGAAVFQIGAQQAFAGVETVSHYTGINSLL